MIAQNVEIILAIRALTLPALKKVSSVLGLKIEQYAKSDYKIENNTDNILHIANV